MTKASSIFENELLGESEVMDDIFYKIQKIAPTDANILILGENGTGMKLLQRLDHDNFLSMFSLGVCGSGGILIDAQLHRVCLPSLLVFRKCPLCFEVNSFLVANRPHLIMPPVSTQRLS